MKNKAPGTENGAALKRETYGKEMFLWIDILTFTCREPILTDRNRVCTSRNVVVS
jgi:hypothetical protein